MNKRKKRKELAKITARAVRRGAKKYLHLLLPASLLR